MNASESEPSSRLPRPDAKLAPRPVTSADLLGGEGRIDVKPHRQVYRLFQTRQGKLILTK